MGYKDLCIREKSLNIATLSSIRRNFTSVRYPGLTSPLMEGMLRPDEFDKFECSKLISFAYIYKRTKKFIWTFASYDEKDEAYSDRNIYPTGCITGIERLNVESR